MKKFLRAFIVFLIILLIIVFIRYNTSSNYDIKYVESPKISKFTGSKKNDKLFIIIGSFFHRSEDALGPLPKIVTGNFNADFVVVDYPKKEFNTHKVLKKTNDYVKKQNYNSIVICGLSFGEILIREWIQNMDKSLKNKIDLHLSISGVGYYKNIYVPTMIKFLNPVIKSKYGNYFVKDLLSVLGNIDRKGIGQNEYLKGVLSKKMVDWGAKVKIKKLQQHKRSASLGINAGVVDRYKKIITTTKEKFNNHNNYKGIYTISIYSTDDSTFLSPKKTAENVLGNNKGEVLKVEDGGHGALVEYPNRRSNKITYSLEKINW